MLIISFLVSVYYNTIIAWVLYYLFESFRSDVPWRDCNNKWNSAGCFEGPPSEKVISPINTTKTDLVSNLTSFILSCPKNFYKSHDGSILKDATANTSFDSCTYVAPKLKILPAEDFLK